MRVSSDAGLLQEALKRKEKGRAARSALGGAPDARSGGKMQQRQDRRRQNLRKKKAARRARLEKARKKGRICPRPGDALAWPEAPAARPRPRAFELRWKVDSASCPSPVCLRLRAPRAESLHIRGRG